MADTVTPTPPTQDQIDQVLAGYGIGPGAPRVVAPATSDDAAEVMQRYGVTLKPSPPSATSADRAAAQHGIVVPSTEVVHPNLKIGGQPGEYFPPATVRAGLNRGLGAQFVGGMPIAGPAVNLFSAAVPGATSSAPTFGQRFYDQQQADRAYAQLHPLLSTGANVAGSLVGYGGIARAAPGLLGMSGPTVGARVWQGIFGGGALNAVDAAMRGENPIAPAIIGGASGGVAPFVGAGAEGAVNLAARSAVPRPGPLANVPRAGMDILYRGLEGETPASIVAATQRMGPRGFLADINPQMTDIAGAISDMPIPARATIQDAYRMRQAGQGGAIDQALTKATQIPGGINIRQYADWLDQQRSAAAAPLYDQFRSMTVTPTDRLTNNIIPRLQKAGAFDEAERLAGITGETSPQSELATRNLDSQIAQAFKDDDQARVAQLIQRKNELIADSMTPAKYDLVKRGLDSKIEQAYSAGNKTVASRLVQLKNDLVGEIGQTNAGQVWNQARQAFAERSNVIDQLEAGYNSPLGGRSAQSVDEFREEWDGLTGPERIARMMGWRKMIAETMGEGGNSAGITRGKLLSPNNQAKMRIMFGDQAADELIGTLRSEGEFADRLPAIVPNWNTGASGQTRAQRAQLFAPQENALSHWMPGLDLTNPLRVIPQALRPGTVAQDFATARAGRIPPSLVPILLTPQAQVPDVANAILQEGRRLASVNRAVSQYVARPGQFAIAGPGQAEYRRRYELAQPLEPVSSGP
jgi:hypothetical protein